MAQAQVDRLAYGPFWTLDSWIRDLSISRGRPIVIRDLDLPGLNEHVTGQLWLHEHYDEILVAANLTPAERLYVVCHEVGHLILGHASEINVAAMMSQFWTIPQALVASRVGKFACSPEHPRHGISHDVGADATTAEKRVAEVESEAEWFATLLIAATTEARERVRNSLRGNDPTDDRLGAVVHRLATTFGYY